ncbi:wall-associated receptor kinase 5-like [Papaver somniferum]|uniref:wall-associated receptor kinase 5-like n=1 Tax=Papaver somniferum TaxID=3469 RepID=UPI000E70560E|nr:wall-associated receptor kinase 5-like [Papaver somniferum]
MFPPKLPLFLHIVIFYVVVSISSLSSSAEFVQGKRCQLNCGNVAIPYPFGIGKECSMIGTEGNGDAHITYNIICDHSYDPPKPFINATNYLEILSISETEVRIRNSFTEFNGRPFKSPIEPDHLEFKNSFNKSGLNYLDLSDTPFMVSYTGNKLYGVGCGLVALFIADVIGPKGVARKECQSSCESISRDGSCSGSGCCQTDVPRDLESIGVAVMGTGTKSTNNFNRFAILAEIGQYTFDSEDLTLDATQISKKYDDKVIPIVLDWGIGYKTCGEAKANLTAYGCGDNSRCNDEIKNGGYRCLCSDGYEGNPYLIDGCKEVIKVIKCEDQNNNPCKGICTNTVGGYNCSCPLGGTGDGRKDGSGCTFQKEEKKEMHEKKEFPVLLVVLGFGLGMVFVSVVGVLLFLSMRKRMLKRLKEKFFEKNGGLLLREQLSSLDSGVEATKLFTSEELEMATNKYDESQVLGRGGHGTVYKGTMSDNRTVAIKKSNTVEQTQIEQFVNEVIILSQINHRNVVKLLGCCLETEVPLLVYEYVSCGTLYQHIHYKGAADTSPLTWEIRLRIAFETASAVAYLHSAASPPIIHRDIKSTNILLEENYTAKVSDFGASRLVPLDQTHVKTLVQGTLGYLDPDYYNTSQLTDKSDVYSFGVVLVELLTGKQPICFERPGEQVNLATYFTSLEEDINVLELIDAGVAKDGNLEQILAVTELARKCLKLKGEDRPSMQQIAADLQGLIRFEPSGWNHQPNPNVGMTNLSPEPVDVDLYSVPFSSTDGSSLATSMTNISITSFVGVFGFERNARVLCSKKSTVAAVRNKAKHIGVIKLQWLNYWVEQVGAQVQKKLNPEPAEKQQDGFEIGEMK